MELNVLSISGGKDSTAMALFAKEVNLENMTMVFADTGNEHQITYEYLDYLESKLGPIKRVKADFTNKIINKRETVKTKWVSDGVPPEIINKVLDFLQPTGNPFLDLCIWKGRFPSTRRRFCSEELKHKPIDEHIITPALEKYDEVVCWQGVRKEESTARAKLPRHEYSKARCGLEIFRPLLEWSVNDVFDMHKRHNINPNPLYKQGMTRVGCMPCIHANKNEILEIYKRFPNVIEKIKAWEQLVSITSKHGISTFMDARVTARHLGTGTSADDIKINTHGIEGYVSWAKTSRGGKQFDLIKTLDITNFPMCSSLYGLCE